MKTLKSPNFSCILCEIPPTFQVCSKFPEFSPTGKCSPIFRFPSRCENHDDLPTGGNLLDNRPFYVSEISMKVSEYFDLLNFVTGCSEHVHNGVQIIRKKIREKFVGIKPAYELSAHVDLTWCVNGEVLCTGWLHK